jgi:5-methylthioadenosine/S-adenosylhomocysteine deaminase
LRSVAGNATQLHWYTVDVDTVIIGGRIRKRGGQVLGLYMNRLKRMVDESRRYLFAATNYREDLFADTLPRLYQ